MVLHNLKSWMPETTTTTTWALIKMDCNTLTWSIIHVDNQLLDWAHWNNYPQNPGRLNTAGLATRRAFCLSGRQFIATRSCVFSAKRPPLAASQTARRVQAAYDGTSLLVRRRAILPGAPPADSCMCRPLQLSDLVSDLPHPVQLQCHELYRRSETGPSRLLAHVHWTNFHHRFVAFILLLLLDVNLRHFYTIVLLIHIVRCPCCVSALTSP